MVLRVNSDYLFNSSNHLIPVVVVCCVFYEVRSENLNIIKASVGFRGLNEKF
jgi:hypothetical protein